MSYRFSVQLRLKEDNHTRIALTDTLERANFICRDYRIANPGTELRIWDYENKKWIIPEYVVQNNSDWKPESI